MKKRLDILVAEKTGYSRIKSQAMIMAGQVLINNKVSDKPGKDFPESTEIKIKEAFPYVSRGALKLKKAASEFGVDFKNKVVCDIGASTGGFSDFALQEGAKKVYAIDVGYGQLAQKIRENPKVKVMERTNIKNVDSLPEPIDIFVVDVSFISLKKVLPQILVIISNFKFKISNCYVVLLVKPQFEAGKEVASKFKGIIKDAEIQKNILSELKDYSTSLGYVVIGDTVSPIKGAKGNTEFLLYLKVKK